MKILDTWNNCFWRRFCGTKNAAVVVAVAWLLVLSFSSGQALGADGHINALSFKPLPGSASIAVKAWDNSDENKDYATRIEAYLKTKGYQIAKEGDLILSFETKETKGIWTKDARSHVLEVEGHGGRRGGEQARVRLNLYSSQEGGLLNSPADPEGRKGKKTAPQIMLEVTVDINKGRRLWQGQASANQSSANVSTLVHKLIPVLMEKMGKTVRRESFDFQ